MTRWLRMLRTHGAETSLLVPQLLFAAIGVVAVLRALLTGGAVWDDSPVNLSEAIAVHDFGLAVRLMEQGADPNVKRTTDAANDGQPTPAVTALEAAAKRGDPWMVEVILDHGAVADAAERLRLACVAVSFGGNEVAEFLHGSVPSPAECPR
jgi:hypothetical protein